MNKGKVELIRFEKKEDTVEFVYTVEQNNGQTTVEQDMTISSQSFGLGTKWYATIGLEEFNGQELPEAVAFKLADWLDRLSQAIRVGEYPQYTKAEFKEIKS
jgi:hypothetical protein